MEPRTKLAEQFHLSRLQVINWGVFDGYHSIAFSAGVAKYLAYRSKKLHALGYWVVDGSCWLHYTHRVEETDGLHRGNPVRVRARFVLCQPPPNIKHIWSSTICVHHRSSTPRNHR